MLESSVKTCEIEATRKVRHHASEPRGGQTRNMKSHHAARDEHSKNLCAAIGAVDSLIWLQRLRNETLLRSNV
jgi:hypothetical protein